MGWHCCTLKLWRVLAPLVPFVALACRQPASSNPAPVDAGVSLAQLRESVRETLDADCGECHTATLPTALPRALHVFDLTEPDFSRRMSDDQLREAARRLHEPVGPTQAATEVRPIRASAAERARFDLYVGTEIASRHTAPPPSSSPSPPSSAGDSANPRP